MKPTLYIVVPCFNEEAVLPLTAPLLLKELECLKEKKLVSAASRILLVDDGSRDGTWAYMTELCGNNPTFTAIRQSRNRGHQNALLAGLMEARSCCDITISVDCDGQDDLTAMGDMVREYLSGSEIVYGVRRQRKSDSFFKRFTAERFYKLLRFSGADIVYNHADYRLISSRALDALAEFKEVNLFLRGLVPLVGFKSSAVYYDRHERLAGKSHYPLRKMIALAVDGITSLSIRPLRIITLLGLVFSLVSLFGIAWSVIDYFLGNTVAGWSSLVCIVLLMGGLQMVCLGVIGEYIGKIYLEAKGRPRYIISERTDDRNIGK